MGASAFVAPSPTLVLVLLVLLVLQRAVPVEEAVAGVGWCALLLRGLWCGEEATSAAAASVRRFACDVDTSGALPPFGPIAWQAL